MTSSPEPLANAPAGAPVDTVADTHSGRRRHHHRRHPLRVVLVAVAAIGVFAMTAYGAWHWWETRPDPAAARTALQRSTDYLAAGNATAARSQALDAVRYGPDTAAAHVALARALIALDDGAGASGALDRAATLGYPAQRLIPLRAHAEVIQGNADRALSLLAAPVVEQDRAYALRVEAQALTAQENYAGALEALDQALQTAPDDADTWVAIGRFRVVVGDTGGAIDASTRAVALDRRNTDALVLRGEMVRTQYGLIAALPWFEAALARDPYHHDALIEYAATLGDAGRTRAMLAATRRALQARPDSPQALYLQAVLAARAGKDDLARILLERAGDTLDDLPGAMLLDGILDLKEGDYGQAGETLGRLVGMQPMNLVARRLLAMAYLRSDMARNAIDVLSPMTERGDADSYSLLLMARALERVGRRDEAATMIDRAAWPARAASTVFQPDESVGAAGRPATERPNDPRTVIPLIRALVEDHDMRSALGWATDLARDNPGAPGAQIALGDVLVLLNRPADAATAYRRAADMRFEEPVMLRLVDALDKSGQRQEASRALALYLSQNPISVPALRLAGAWQSAAGAYDAAIDTLEGLRRRIGGRDAALDIELANAYLGANQAQAALELAEAGFALAPGNPAAADAYGWALFQLDDPDSALELLEEAASIAPGHPAIRAHLAAVRAALAPPGGASARNAPGAAPARSDSARAATRH